MTNIDPINEYIFKYVWASSSSASLYVYDTDRSALLDSRTLETNIPIVDLRVYFSTYSWIYGSVSKLVCDWTLLREYAPSEPETSLGSEEGLQDWTRTIEGLTESTYTVPGGEALPEGIYYWHVRAVDGAGNVGYWSGVWQFTVANVPQVITITTVEQLQAMNDNLSDHYVLGNDIDASATAGWNGGLGFDPIGTRIDDYFAGSFDGRGYTIYNLYINRPFANNVGLFGYIGTGSIAKNVGLVNVYVYGSFSVGGLVGYNAGTVSNSYSTGTTRGFYVGGFVGTNDGTISNSYSTCSVIGDFVAGGSAVGGFVGYNYGGTIYNSYSKGPVSGSSHIGGFAGANLGDIFDSFWDKQTSGKSTSAGGTGKTTTQMKDIRTYTDTTWSVGLTTPWDFVDNPYGDEGTEDIWNIYPAVNDGYPFFTWS